MNPGDLLSKLRGGLIVSIQPNAASVLATPETVALFARCAAANGAAAVRIEGTERLRAARAAVALPIVGLVKRRYAGFEPYITSTLDELDAIIAAGADAVAFDATSRERQGGMNAADLVRTVRERGRVAFADCAELDDARAASAAGAEIVASTLAGYTPRTQQCALPALDLVRSMTHVHAFVVCEGGIASADSARAAFAAGASAITVGTALTDLDARIASFAATCPQRCAEDSR